MQTYAGPTEGHCNIKRALALPSFPSLNRLAQNLTNHAGPPTLAEQTWTCFGQWQLPPWARVEAGGHSRLGAGRWGRPSAEKANGASSVLTSRFTGAWTVVSNATLGAVGHIGSLGCQRGGMVSAPLQRVHPEKGWKRRGLGTESRCGDLGATGRRGTTTGRS